MDQDEDQQQPQLWVAPDDSGGVSVPPLEQSMPLASCPMADASNNPILTPIQRADDPGSPSGSDLASANSLTYGGNDNNGNGAEGGDGGGSGSSDSDQHRAALEIQIAERRAERDARVDELGIEKPATSFVETWTDDLAPPELMNDPETSGLEKAARGLGAGVVSLWGAAADELSPLDTRGDLRPPVPILGGVKEQAEKDAYDQERAKRLQEIHDEETRKARENLAPDQ